MLLFPGCPYMIFHCWMGDGNNVSPKFNYVVSTEKQSQIQDKSEALYSLPCVGTPSVTRAGDLEILMLLILKGEFFGLSRKEWWKFIWVSKDTFPLSLRAKQEKYHSQYFLLLKNCSSLKTKIFKMKGQQATAFQGSLRSHSFLFLHCGYENF